MQAPNKANSYSVGRFSALSIVYIVPGSSIANLQQDASIFIVCALGCSVSPYFPSQRSRNMTSARLHIDFLSQARSIIFIILMSGGSPYCLIDDNTSSALSKLSSREFLNAFMSRLNISLVALLSYGLTKPGLCLCSALVGGAVSSAVGDSSAGLGGRYACKFRGSNR